MHTLSIFMNMYNIIPTREHGNTTCDFPFHLFRFSFHKIFSINLISQKITRHLNASSFFLSLTTRSVSHSKAKYYTIHKEKHYPIFLIKMSVTPFRSQFLCQEDRRICHKNFLHSSSSHFKKLYSPRSKVVGKRLQKS